MAYAVLSRLEAGADAQESPADSGAPLHRRAPPRRRLPIALAGGALAAASASVAWLSFFRERARALSRSGAGDVVSDAAPIYQLTNPGKGCANWADVMIGDFIHPDNIDGCMQRCADDASCIGLNYQSGDPVECKDGVGTKGQCMLVSKSCDYEDNPCWDFYEKVMPISPETSAEVQEHVRMAVAPAPAQAECADSGAECWHSRCCKDPEDTCFAKDLGWAQCLKSCSAGVKPNEPDDVQTGWLCIPVVPKQGSDEDEDFPGTAVDVRDQVRVTLPWFASDCASEGEYCMEKACCSSSMTCFEKHSLFAACKRECVPGVDESEPREQQTPWSCEEVKKSTSESLFCFALMVPGSHEARLLEAQMGASAGIFGCDASVVYSNRSIKLTPTAKGSHAPSIKTQVVKGSLHCELGGIYHTALNSEIFVRVWKTVLAGREHAGHDWTVKVDPDAVLLPSRLKQHVANYRHLQGRQASVFLNNCKDGLHGPVEVLSRAAMKVYKGGIDQCVDKFRKEFSEFGEDVFLRHCLEHLGVGRVDDFGLLKETHCDPFPGVPTPCNMGRVAFHPLKTPESWLQCFAQASQEEQEKKPAKTTAEAAETCEQYGGIAHFDKVTCCSLSCGEHCGAPDCKDHNASECCGGGIPDSQACSDTLQAPCTMRTVLKQIAEEKRREKAAAKEAEAAAKKAKEATKEAKEAEALEATPWECVDYAQLHKSNETGSRWCRHAGVHRGAEYKFFGADSPCSPCWCCKRSSKKDGAPPAGQPQITAEDVAALQKMATVVAQTDGPAEENDEPKEKTTDQGYIFMGRGFCVDGAGQEYPQYRLYDTPLGDCQSLCSGVQQCLGFTLETSTQHCVVHTAGDEPVYWASWDATYTDGFAGAGRIEGASGSEDAECYKMPWRQPTAEETH